jgi:hypothetical protein
MGRRNDNGTEANSSSKKLIWNYFWSTLTFYHNTDFPEADDV